MTHYFFTCGTRRSARAITSFGVPLWLYRFQFVMHSLEYDIVGGAQRSRYIPLPSCLAAWLPLTSCDPCRLPRSGSELRV